MTIDVLRIGESTFYGYGLTDCSVQVLEYDRFCIQGNPELLPLSLVDEDVGVEPLVVVAVVQLGGGHQGEEVAGAAQEPARIEVAVFAGQDLM